jgi:deazaflavin-dependent oxidoreductase (nitroreductase family)
MAVIRAGCHDVSVAVIEVVLGCGSMVVDVTIEGEYEPSTSEWVRNHVSSITEAGTTDVATIRGLPVVMMTMRGARSGKVRKVPVMRVEHDGEYAVVASQGGAPVHPSWYFNLKAGPNITLQDGPESHEYTVRELDGAERALWWDRAVAAYPDYAEYQTRTTRLIPVLVAERVD